MVDARVPGWAALTVCVALVAAALAMTWASTALAGDGSFVLVRLLDGGDVFSLETRYVGNAVRQAPVLAGAAAGITDTQALSMLLGVGQLVLPALIWAACVLLTREDRIAFTVLVLIAGICTGTTWALSVSENVLAVPLTALATVLLWMPRPWGRLHGALAVATSVVLIATYEAALITGAILAGWAVARAIRSESRGERATCLLFGALSLLSVAVASQGLWHEADPTHSQSLVNAVVSFDPWPLYLSILGLIAFVLGSGPWFAEQARSPLLVAGTTAMIVALAGFEVSTTGALAARGGASAALLVLQVALLWLWVKPPRAAASGDRIDPRLLAIPVAYVVAILAINVWALKGWSESLTTFRNEVDDTRGVRFAEDVIPPDRREVLWFWASSSLSLILRGDPDAGILVDRRPRFVPFPPSEAREQLSDEYVWGG